MRLLRILSLVLLVVWATACGVGGSSTTSNSNQPYRFLIILPQTGAQAAFSVGQIGALKAAAKVINQKYGGIGGRMVQVESLDNGGDQAKTATLLQQRLSAPPAPDALFAWYGTELALAPITTQNKIFTLAATPPPQLNDPSKYPYFFSVLYGADSQAQGDCDYVKSKGYTKIGIIYSQAYLNIGDAMVTCAAKDGITAVPETYPATAVDLTAITQRFQAQNVQAVVGPAFGGAPLGYLIDAMKKLQWQVPIVVDWGGAGTPLPPNALNNPSVDLTVVSLKFVKYVPPDQQSDGLKAYIAALKAEIGVTAFTNGGPYSAIVWDSAFLTYTAAKLAGSTDPAKMAHAIEKSGVNCALCAEINTFDFSPTSHYPGIMPGDLVAFKFNCNTRIDNMIAC